MNKCNVCTSSNVRYHFSRDGYKYYQCKFCKLVKIYPQPTDRFLNNLYSRKYYQAWNLWAEEESVRVMKKKTFARRLKLIPYAVHKKILDCGCATGFFLELVEDRGFIAYGVEINKTAVNLARRRFKNNRIFLGSLEKSPFKKDSFYAIFMNDFLEHTRCPEIVVRKAYFLLEQGGYLIIATPNTNSLSCHILGRKWPHYKTEHLFYFNSYIIKFKPFLPLETSFVYNIPVPVV